MKKFINFCKNNILEILFLFGVIGIYAGYCLYLTEFQATWLNLLFSFCTFIVEFVWLLFLSYFAKTSRTLVKLLFLNLLAIISLVIICSIPSSQLPLMILIGILSFLFSWTIFVAIMQTKNLTFKDNKDIGKFYDFEKEFNLYCEMSEKKLGKSNVPETLVFLKNSYNLLIWLKNHCY